MRKTGTYQTLGDLRYFIPNPLPPMDPSLILTPEIMSLYGEAIFALGQLNEMSVTLPDPKRFIKAYVLKEALLSSAIEGIHTTLIDAFTYPLAGLELNKDTQLVLNYTKAMNVALTLLEEGDLPLVSRVILRAHEALLSGQEDSNKATPGLYRKQSVRVGQHIPPPATEVPGLITALEKYINEPSELPPLIRAGLAHVQFETIHPFLDGNGRIGRLLIVLMLMNDELLRLPILYPSYYFKKYHMEYYQKLDLTRTHGDFEGWTIFYLTAIRDSAMDAYTRAKEIGLLEKNLKAIIEANHQFSKMRETAQLAIDCLFANPVIGITNMSQKMGKSYNTIANIIQKLIELKIVTEDAEPKRNKLYRFTPYLSILEKDL